MNLENQLSVDDEDGQKVIELAAGPVLVSVRFPSLLSQKVAQTLRSLSEEIEQ